MLDQRGQLGGKTAMAFITAVLLILMLAGCTMTYTKPGLTQEEFNRDRYECQRAADAAAAGAAVGGTSNPFAARERMQQCMESKGYTRQ